MPPATFALPLLRHCHSTAVILPPNLPLSVISLHGIHDHTVPSQLWQFVGGDAGRIELVFAAEGIHLAVERDQLLITAFLIETIDIDPLLRFDIELLDRVEWCRSVVFLGEAPRDVTSLVLSVGPSEYVMKFISDISTTVTISNTV